MVQGLEDLVRNLRFLPSRYVLSSFNFHMFLIGSVSSSSAAAQNCGLDLSAGGYPRVRQPFLNSGLALRQVRNTRPRVGVGAPRVCRLDPSSATK